MKLLEFVIALFVVVSLARCSGYNGVEFSGDPQPQDPLEIPTPEPTPFDALGEGFWGNGVARLEVRSDSAHFELGCAHGDISDEIILSKTGTFAVLGTYVIEGGPEPEGGRTEYQALYSGKVTKSKLRLRVAYVKDHHTYASNYTLTYHSTQLPIKCR